MGKTGGSSWLTVVIRAFRSSTKENEKRSSRRREENEQEEEEKVQTCKCYHDHVASVICFLFVIMQYF